MGESPGPAGDGAADDGAASHGAAGGLPPAGGARRPATPFESLARQVLLHRNPQALMTLHAYAEKLLGNRRLWQDTLDPLRMELEGLAREVRRDLHKMKAFVRFTRTQAQDGGDHYIAWFEPVHRIVHAIAPFFTRRFAGMRWTILTPDASVHWNGTRLIAGPAARREDAPPPDADEKLWLTYYERIFNPARVKVAAMKREMPVRYWNNLPESRSIARLIAQAPERVAQMVNTAETRERRRGSLPAGSQMREPAVQLSPMQSLRRRIDACDHCEMAACATQAVAGRGSESARVMLVGEQPGDREDLCGEPFVGPSGEWLRAALAGADIDIDSLYLTNAVKHFKYSMRGKRRMHKTPAQREIDQCLQHLQDELDIVQPQRVVALGRTAQQALSAARLPAGCTVSALSHPSAWLRRGHAPGDDAHAQWAADLALQIEEPAR